jgi:group I intron endonuclease
MVQEVGVYQILCSENNSIYIGSSSNIKARWAAHRSKLKRQIHNPKMNNCFNKYGMDSFVFSIIENCDILNLIERETYWAEYFKNNGFKLLNCGEFIDNPTRGVKLSSERKKQISEFLKGNKYTSGKKLSEEHKKQISKTLTGHKMSEKNNIILDIYRKKPKTEYSKKKMSESKILKIGVKVLCLQTNKTYPSLIDAAKDLQTSYQCVRQAIIRGGKVKGLNFVLLNNIPSGKEIENLINTDLRKNPKNYNYKYKEFSRGIFGKKILCKELNKIFSSVSETSEYFGVSPTTIRTYLQLNKKINNYSISYHV